MINSKVKSQTRSTTRGAKVQTKAFSDVNLAISGANAMMLALAVCLNIGARREPILSGDGFR